MSDFIEAYLNRGVGRVPYNDGLTAWQRWKRRHPDKAARSTAASFKKWRQTHLAASQEAQRQSDRRRREKKAAFLLAAKSKPCHDCGVQYPYYVMQFDHRPNTGKQFHVSHARNIRWQFVLDEIAKCDIVCANCHAERTHTRRQARATHERSRMGAAIS